MKISKEEILENLSAVKTYVFWKELIIMTLGILVTAMAIYYFLMPNKIIVGHVSAFCIVINGVLEYVGITIKVSTLILCSNIILLSLAYFMVGSDFGAKTVYTAILLGPLIDLCEWVYPYTNFFVKPGQTTVTGDLWFDLCWYVLLLSVAQAMLFRINASTGGLDIVAKILNKYFHFDIGTSLNIAGLIICFSAFAIHPFSMVAIGMLGTWLNGIAVDYFTASLNKRKRVSIIGHHPEEVKNYILHELVRGCSLYEVTGAYTGEKLIEIQSLLTQAEFGKLLEYMRKNDYHAFITASNISEIYGLWYQRKEKKQIHDAAIASSIIKESSNNGSMTKKIE